MLARFPDFRRRLQARIWRIRLRARDVQIELLDRLIDLNQDPIVVEKMAADRLNTSAQLKDRMTSALYERVGHALSSWAGMESSLVTIAGYLLETPRVRAGVVMYSIMNFNAWLSVIGELFPLDERFAHLKPQWNKTSEKLRALKDTRDRLAHHTTYHAQPEDDVSVTGVTLRPINLDRRQKSQKYQPLNVDQISEFIQSLAKSIHALVALQEAMAESMRKHGPLTRKAFREGLGQDPE